MLGPEAAGTKWWTIPRMPAVRALHALLLVLLGGCASGGTPGLSRPSPETLPPYSPLRVTSLQDGDAWLRHHLVSNDTEEALALVDPGRRDLHPDRLLRALQEAIVLREAGNYVRSNEVLEWAESEADLRSVRSVSRTAGSFVLSDRVLSFVPDEGEAAMIPYYRMMNHLSLGDTDAAAVEARRLSALLLGTRDLGVRQCRQSAMLQYVSAFVFEAAGELDDALVSLRQADESFLTCPGGRAAGPPHLGGDLLRLAKRLGFEELGDSAAAWYPGTEETGASAEQGQVVLLLERGFVPHLTDSAIHVPIFEEEIENLESGDLDGIASVVGMVTARLVGTFAERGYWGRAWNDEPGVQVAQALGGAYILKLAWPGLDGLPKDRTSVELLVHGDTIDAVRIGDLAEVAVRSLEENQKAMLGRLVTRGVTKYLISREAEKKAEKEGGELLGFITARIANIAANQTERADTRSWTLLPADISMVRLSLPAGEHELRVETVGVDGARARLDDLAPIEVLPGELRIINHRIWTDRPLPEGSATAADEG